MMEKKKKSTKKTTSNRVEITAGRRMMLCNFDHEKAREAFLAVAETIRQALLESISSPEERGQLAKDEPFFQWVYHLVELGWNLSILHDGDEATVKKRMARDVNFSQLGKEENTLVIAAVRCKAAKHPDEDLLVDRITFERVAGGVEAKITFDENFARCKAEKLMRDQPRLADILDSKAIEKALEGVPPEQKDEAIKNEIARQIEAYNNTPQAQLGGKTPREMFLEQNMDGRTEAKEAPFCKLRIILRGAHVPIKRTVMVPSDLRLDLLHEVLQVVMGWRNCHLHQFRVKKKCYGIPDEDFPELKVQDEKRYCLSDLVTPESPQFAYLYDFGDSWEHSVKVVDFDVKDVPTGRLFYCTAGKGACPPEDVGGPGGYEEFCQAFIDPKHPEHDEMLEWVYPGCGYQKTQTWPDGFSREGVNAELKALAKRCKKARSARKRKPKA